VAQGIVNKVVVQYIERNRESLKRKYPDFDKYYREFNIDDAFIGQLRKTAEAEKLTIIEDQLTKSKSLISLQLKALIARDLWSMNEYFRIMDNENESLKKAISILEKEGEYDRLLRTTKTKTK
jgi:carboxyl-terminal processing protease